MQPHKIIATITYEISPTSPTGEILPSKMTHLEKLKHGIVTGPQRFQIGPHSQEECIEIIKRKIDEFKH